MNLRHALALYVFICIALCSVVPAQNVDIPDPNLRRVVKEALNLTGGDPITQADMRRLTTLEARGQQIADLSGLEHAVNIIRIDLGENSIRDLRPLAALTQLEYAELRKNPISDLSPLANLVQLHTLFVWQCQISDISPLANLTRLQYLDLNANRITDISPLANLTDLIELSAGQNALRDIQALSNLTKLKYLNINRNMIRDVSPLSGLINLDRLYLDQNNISDFSPLDGLSLSDLTYDEICDMPRLPLAERLENRTFPSIYTFFGGGILNIPELTSDETYPQNMAKHDFLGGENFALKFREISAAFRDLSPGIHVVGLLERAVAYRDQLLSFNPNMVFIAEIRFRDTGYNYFPPESPYWVRDEQGNIVQVDDNLFLMDFTHPDVQDIIVGQVVAASRCGLYDGVFLDWWNDHGPSLNGYRTNEAEQRARDNIIQRIRAQTPDDFLIIGNTNDRIIPRTGQFLNGTYMEGAGNGPQALDSLQWLENNLLSPQLNCLQGNSITKEPPDSLANLQRMRAVTTLSLTNSNGYVVFVIGGADIHYWYDFWDADLGRPVGEKSQLYQNIDGLYIREFTNGWAVYNHSGEAQLITLPEEAQGVASGLVNIEHAIPDLDGEIYLRIIPQNPADVNGDGVVNILDLVVVAQGFGTDSLQGDVNGDGVVNVFDLVFVAEKMQ